MDTVRPLSRSAANPDKNRNEFFFQFAHANNSKRRRRRARADHAIYNCLLIENESIRVARASDKTG